MEVCKIHLRKIFMLCNLKFYKQFVLLLVSHIIQEIGFWIKLSKVKLTISRDAFQRAQMFHEIHWICVRNFPALKSNKLNAHRKWLISSSLIFWIKCSISINQKNKILLQQTIKMWYCMSHIKKYPLF